MYRGFFDSLFSLDFLLFLFMAGFVGWAFKMLVGLLSGIIGFVIAFILRIKLNNLGEVLINHPKKFFSYGIILNTIIGSVYSIIIASTTFWYLVKYNGNPWLYAIAAAFWGLSIIEGAETFNGILISSCVGGVIIFFLGYGYLSGLFWLIVALISMAYYFGRIDIIKENPQDYNF